MRVRDDNGVEFCGIKTGGDDVQVIMMVEALEHAEIHEHTGAIGLEQIRRAGDGAGRAEESEFDGHGCLVIAENSVVGRNA